MNVCLSLKDLLMMSADTLINFIVTNKKQSHPKVIMITQILTECQTARLEMDLQLNLAMSTDMIVEI